MPPIGAGASRVLFHNVIGSKLPVLTNIYGSRERLADIIGIGAADFCKQWNNLATIAGSRDIPTTVPAQGGIEYVNCKVSDLPLLTYSERDAAPYFTSAMFLAKEPDTGVQKSVFPPLDVCQRHRVALPARATPSPDDVS